MFKNSVRSITIAFLFILLSLNAVSQTLEEQVKVFYDEEDCLQGIKFIHKNYGSLKSNTYVNYLLGEMGMDCKDYEMAKKGYERALQLAQPEWNRNIHEKINGSQDTEIYWGANDGLGYVYYALGDYKKSLASLEEANKWLAHTVVHTDDIAKHYYNLACAYSLNNKFENAVKALTTAIEYDDENKERARDDSDFDGMRKFSPFINLLKE